MLLSGLVLLIGMLISAFNLASGFVIGNIFGFSVSLWGSILCTLFLALGLTSLLARPLARRAKRRGLICFFAFLSGILVFTLAFLEPKAAIELKSGAMHEELKPFLTVLILLFVPNLLMAMMIPAASGSAMRSRGFVPERGKNPPRPDTGNSNPDEDAEKEEPSPESGNEEEAIPVEPEPELAPKSKLPTLIRVLEVEKTDRITAGKDKGSDIIEMQPAELAQGAAPADPVKTAEAGQDLIRLHQSLLLFGLAIGAFLTFLSISISDDPWLVLTVVAMSLLMVSFFGAAFIVRSLVTASVVAYFLLSATMFVELAPSPGFIDRVLADEEAEMSEKEKSELAADSLEVRRYSAAEVKELFDSLAASVIAAPDKTMAISLVIDLLVKLEPGVMSGTDMEKVVSDIFRDSPYRPNVMPFVESIKSVKRRRQDRKVVVSLRQRRDGSHAAVLVPRLDGSTLKIVFLQSFDIDIKRKDSTTIVEFGPHKTKPGFLSTKHITPLRAIDVLGPIDATLISLKVVSKGNEVVLYATGQGPIGGKTEVEIVRMSKEGKIGMKSNRKRGLWKKLICKLGKRDKRRKTD
jgi:hypothetical protein